MFTSFSTRLSVRPSHPQIIPSHGILELRFYVHIYCFFSAWGTQRPQFMWGAGGSNACCFEGQREYVLRVDCAASSLPLKLATAVAVTCRNPVLQTSQISVAAEFSLFFFLTESQSTLHSQYTFAIFHTHKTNPPCVVGKQLLSTDTVSTFTFWSQLHALDGKRGTHGLTWPSNNQTCRTQKGRLQNFVERNDALVMPLNRIRTAPWYASWPQAGHTYWFRALFLRPLKRILWLPP